MSCKQCNEKIEALITSDERIQRLLYNSQANPVIVINSTMSRTVPLFRFATQNPSTCPSLGDQIYIHCRPCQENGIEGNSRAFLQSSPTTVVLCSNRLKTQEEIRQSLTHELTHAFDFLLRKLHHKDVRHLAYRCVRLSSFT